MDMLGHNKPPTDAEMIRENLAEKNAKAIKRAEALIAAADRVPEAVNDTETSEKITDLEKQITVCWNALENARKDEKAPYWDMCKVVDGFFNETLLSGLDAAKKRVKKIQTNFLVDQEKKERERRAGLERQAQVKRDAELAEAAKLEQEGKLSQADAKVEKAIVHDHDAAFFGVAAQAKGASVAASTGELTGARSSLRYTWTGEILDANNAALRDALWNLVPLDAKQKALNTFVKLGGREVGGAKIWEKPEATTR
jgi:hypothetical protein